MIVISQVRTCTRAPGGVVELVALVLPVVDLDVARIDFGQVFEQLGPVGIPGNRRPVEPAALNKPESAAWQVLPYP
jgi:hypothetical protein